jgi:hypothetical protein
MLHLRSNNNAAASAKPNKGDSSNASPTSFAFDQSTPDVPLRTCSSAFATPTPMMEPTRVCELDAGSPKPQVPRFQIIAAIRCAKTIAKPALLPTCRISSTGKSEIMPKATAPEDARTPARLNIPDHTTAKFAGSERV